MKEQVLSTEQMQELIDMGIDTSNASMYWTPENYLDVIRNEYDRDAIPDLNFTYAFTFQDILEMLPKVIVKDDVEYYKSIKEVIGVVEICYISKVHQRVLCGEIGANDNPYIEAAFNMLKWCKENNEI